MQTTMRDEFDELLALYALGALEGDDRDRLETHLSAGCPECARELAELERTGALLAWAAPAAAPPPSLRGRVLDAAAVRASLPSAEPIPFRPRSGREGRGSRAGAVAAAVALLAAAAVAIFVLTTWLVAARSSLDDAVRQLADAKAAGEQKDAKLREQERRLGVVADAQTRVVKLGPAVDVMWNARERRGLLVARDLPKAAEGRTYELWFIAGSTPVPAAVFNTDAGGYALVDIESLPVDAKPEMFAVTDEPAGGSPAPTTKPIFAGAYGA